MLWVVLQKSRNSSFSQIIAEFNIQLMKAWRCWDWVEIFRFKLSLLWVRKFFLAIVFEMQTRDIAPSRAYTKTTGLTFSKDDKQHFRLSYHDNWLACFVGLQLTSQPRSQSSSVISDVTSPVRACQVCLENLLGFLASCTHSRPTWGRGCRNPWFDQLGPVNVT